MISPDSRKRITVIHNPTAGGARQHRFDAVTALLRNTGCALNVLTTKGPDDAEELARLAVSSDACIVLAAGGDGTINEVINGMAGAETPLAILPLGTANVLALEIGLSLDPEAIADSILNGPVRNISLGKTRTGSRSRYFSLMVGAGFDAHVVADVSTDLKRRIGKGAYVWEMVRQLFKFPFPEYSVRLDGREVKAASVVVANARYYAGRYILAPHAGLETPKLEACVFERGGPFSTILYAIALDRGKLETLSSFHLYEAAKVEILGPAGDPLQMDGDGYGAVPVEITIEPNALRLITPMND